MEPAGGFYHVMARGTYALSVGGRAKWLAAEHAFRVFECEDSGDGRKAFVEVTGKGK
jgi:hypothetical protein